ncbi:itt1p [Saccharomyces arboricola H-6]|uniref:RBR-type E3 ubiquitin transferase n=1 Tax=Saccharomyces arboricola (strain H-6 / AS 2.3317 / CBS 10644) TaxID=1160507 RepID=J8Q4I3_SACAR|nr:itt1p [Saccharomyces arboricola H-6]
MALIQFENDLELLRDMYPELEMNLKKNEFPKRIEGQLLFKISLLNDVSIGFGEQGLLLSNLSNECLNFKICCHQCTDIRQCVTMDIKSSWMSTNEKEMLINEALNLVEETVGTKAGLENSLTSILILVFGFLIDDTAKLLFPDNLKTCVTQKQYDVFEQISEKATLEKINRSNYHCCICMEMEKGVRVIKLPCQNKDVEHYLCRKCAKSYFTAMIKEGRISNVRCPQCEYKEVKLEDFKSYEKMKKVLFTPLVPVSFLRELVDTKLCERYEKLFYSQAATKLSKYCPYACVTCRRCDQWCTKEDLDDTMIQCQKCHFVFCFDCLHAWHGYNNKCGKKVTIPKDIIEEYMDDNSTSGERKQELKVKYGKRTLELEVNDYLAEAMLNLAIQEEGSNLQRCPRCKVVVERSEGCNKMTCGMCGTLFCFICGSLLHHEDPYEHFRELSSGCYGRLFEGMPGTET